MSMLLGAAMLTASAGCGGAGGNNRPVPLDVAFNNHKEPANNPQPVGPLAERAGQAMYNDSSIDQLNPRPAPTDQSSPANGSPNGVIAEPVRKAMEAPTFSALRAATQTSPSTAPSRNGPATAPGAGTGVHLTLGSLVCEVNGAPIYAHQVIEPLAPMLAAKARQMDTAQFKMYAANEIAKMTGLLIRNELEYAIADRSLDADEKHVARALNEKFREDLIRKAGGSLQVARQQIAAQGFDFDRVVQEQYKVKLRSVYMMRKEWPKVQVTAQDMRAYYDKHKNDLFSERAQAQFRVIKIGIKQTGSRELAKKKIDDLHRRAVEGEDFAELAANYNDDPYLTRARGAVSGENGWMDRGAYANQKVEDAVWAINPGEVTDVIEGPDAFFIARLDQKKNGRVRSFDEAQVQEQIRNTLQDEQFRALREKRIEQLKADAVIYPDPPLLQPALDIAMQNYPAWSARR
jgi:parvulin-like peptidyl-prolyl isomerase